jgi:hypothetical protein
MQTAGELRKKQALSVPAANRTARGSGKSLPVHR